MARPPQLSMSAVYSLEQKQICLVVGDPAEGAVAARISVLGEEGGPAAIFPRHVEAQPGIELVADTNAEQRRVLDVVMEDLEVVEARGLAAPTKPLM